MTWSSSPSSPAPAGSISGSTPPAGAAPGRPSSTPSAGACSPPGGLTSPGGATFGTWTLRPAGPSWSVGGSPARTSPSPGRASGSPGSAPGSGGSSSGSSTLFDPEPYSWRTWTSSSGRMVELISEPSWTRWSTGGMAWAGECSTRSTSACRSGDDVCSCSPALEDVLEASAPRRYWVSPRAARGILSRARRKSRELLPELEAALEAVAASSEPSPGDHRPALTTRASGEDSSSSLRLEFDV